MATKDNEENPIVATLPPEADYMTWLTIVDQHLTTDQLPLLYDLLGDSKLTINVGWDLVALLTGFLPESRDCLDRISFLGNPRETVLKVAELLDRLGTDTEEEDEPPHIEQPETEDEDEDKDEVKTHEVREPEKIPEDLLSIQFHSLLHMLCILHPRIQTKNPSRFLTTSLQAVIKSFRQLGQAENPHGYTDRLESGIRAILMLIKSLSGSKRPHLPPRRSQSVIAIPTVSSGEAAPDPEGGDSKVAAGESDLQKQILLSFITHVIEVYVQSLEPSGLVDSAFAWSTRYYERSNPVPGKPKFAEVNEMEDELERADATMSQLLVSGENLPVPC